MAEMESFAQILVRLPSEDRLMKGDGDPDNPSEPHKVRSFIAHWVNYLDGARFYLHVFDGDRQAHEVATSPCWEQAHEVATSPYWEPLSAIAHEFGWTVEFSPSAMSKLESEVIG